MFCKYCGKEIEDNAKFCKFCGVKMVSNIIPEQSDVEKSEEDRKGITEVFKENYNKAVKEAEEKNKTEKTENIKKQLQTKDGKKHVLFLAEDSIGSIQKRGEAYNKEMNEAMNIIQEEGYEILDMKISSTRDRTTITLIIYK